MRSVDVEPIRAALAQVRGESAQETARLHRLEQLRTRLLADEKVLGEIAARHPSADLQQLRSLRRSALKEQERMSPPRSYRAIFQLLKELDASAAIEGDDGGADEANARP
jgi:ribosome-associated protein